MSALIRKELRQILPAQLVLTAIATVAWFAIVDADRALAPYDPGQGAFHFAIAVFALIQGLILGVGQFGSERWLGTEAYLVHRGTGRAGAFRAKVVAACAGLAVLVIVPPLAYGAFQFFVDPFASTAGMASVARLAQAVAAASVAFSGYALGAYVSQLRRGVWVSIVLALVGGFGVLLIVLVAVMPTAKEPPTWTRFALVLLGLVAALLGSARRSFRQRRTAQGALARCAGVLQVVVALALVLPAFLFALSAAQGAFLTRWDDYSTHVVEDAKGELYVATPTDVDRESLRATHPRISPYGKVYELVDRSGARVPAEQSLEYTGYGSTSDAFDSICAPFMLSNGPIEQPDPRESLAASDAAFVLGGLWSRGSEDTLDWCLDRKSGALWTRFKGRLLQAPLRFTSSWRYEAGLRPDVQPLWSVSRDSRAVFLDESTGRFQRLAELSEGEATLVDVPLPDGDRFVRLERLIDARSARIGYRGLASGELVRGERDVYAWNGESWVVWSRSELADRLGMVAEFEAAELRDWTLEFGYEDGQVDRLTVRDARTGETRMILEPRDPSSPQRMSLALAMISCVGLPPPAAAFAWWSAERSDANPLAVRVDLVSPELLKGRKHAWIAVTLVLLAIAMVRDLSRRLREGGAPTELRIAWCLATALAGLPAYFACRLLEAHAVRAPRNKPAPEARAVRYEIRTA